VALFYTDKVFIHDTDKVERGLMVLFFGLVFFDAPPTWKLFCGCPCMSEAKILLLPCQQNLLRCKVKNHTNSKEAKAEHFLKANS